MVKTHTRTKNKFPCNMVHGGCFAPPPPTTLSHTPMHVEPIPQPPPADVGVAILGPERTAACHVSLL
ncbi:Uncharacterized protein TCM_029687 [Theobroma cacao]|uniref:Uncharacterized protein n=1 Tax=Theobroma cacao TaxID=3641 RepID=A0A061GFP6_THECC|nr:Uncharacterized protein TCM_029687 [Theobroma cacao]